MITRALALLVLLMLPLPGCDDSARAGADASASRDGGGDGGGTRDGGADVAVAVDGSQDVVTAGDAGGRRWDRRRTGRSARGRGRWRWGRIRRRRDAAPAAGDPLPRHALGVVEGRLSSIR